MLASPSPNSAKKQANNIRPASPPTSAALKTATSSQPTSTPSNTTPPEQWQRRSPTFLSAATPSTSISRLLPIPLTSATGFGGSDQRSPAVWQAMPKTYNVRILQAGETVTNVIGSRGFTHATQLWHSGVTYAKSQRLLKADASWPQKCCVRYCRNAAGDGGYVWIGAFGGWYVVPVCHDPHNKPGNHPTMSGQENAVVGGTIAVEDDRPTWRVYVSSYWERLKYAMRMHS